MALTAKQTRALAALLTSPSITQAARAAACGEASLRRWLKEPAFAAAYREAQQQQWQEICLAAGAPGKETDRLEICKLMCAKLGPDVPEQARVWLLRQLEYIGRGEAVAAVGKSLDDPSDLVRETAIRSLANNPAQEASTPLVAKLPSADAKMKVSIAKISSPMLPELSITRMRSTAPPPSKVVSHDSPPPAR